jgi:hypothetical protein
VGGLGLTRSDDQENRLKEKARWWREEWWEELGEPVIPFAGHVYTYATLPGLSEGWGRQPVVEVNTYEYEPRVMPVASSVDRFFDSYSRFLEALIAHPRLPGSSYTELAFPWDATDILARDERLVELMRARRFDSLMKHVKQSKATRRWFESVAGVPM